MAHTPGPHRAQVGPEGAFQITDNSGYLVLCSRSEWPHRAAESEANGHLFGAASEMLAALKAVRARFQGLRLSPDESVVLDRVSAAIAKAQTNTVKEPLSDGSKNTTNAD